ncbi:MAG: sigma 54-interacting transcriptional regulator [Pyrinomonadaceae bacterium]
MNPRLIALSGSARGTTFALSDGEVLIGRDADSTVRLNHPSVSRRHCLIKRVGNEFHISDLDSYNGTFVNGVPITGRELAHGDQVALGDIVFLFLAHEGEPGAVPAVQMDESGLVTRSTIRLLPEDAVYLRPEKAFGGLPPTARIALDLNALLKISTIINAVSDIRELQHRLLESILEVIPAEREAILLVDGSQELFTSICGWNRASGPDDSIRLSRTITNEVLREVVALLSNDILENESIGGTPSLMATHVCSVLCVPMVAFDKPLGVIYLDTSDPSARFDERHLQLLTAIAGISAIALQNVRHLESLKGENQRLQEEVHLEHRMIGESARMREVYSLLAKVAATTSTVLLRGESGTGKELAAHAIHLNSSRTAKPFVAINCATLSETLLESELFGHEKGAFTGAIAQRRGKLEVADRGTVFLDEVGELTPMIQAKLLRVLQEREFERVGGTRSIKVDVRIIAATNKDLEQAIKDGAFRQDLYYRLNVVSIAMPELKERREDISLLASYFAAKYSKQCKRRVSGISREARAALQSYDWPGNVRELENALERAVVMGSADRIELEDLPEALLETAGASLQNRKYYDAIREAKKQIIRKALDESQGNYTEAAKLLGIHANNLHRLMRTLNLREPAKAREK